MARWRLNAPDSGLVDELVSAAGVDRLCATVLANRGLAPEAVESFMSPTLKNISAPEEEVWKRAARRIAQAIKGGERIGIFGDYDTDGVTSAAVLKLALERYTDNLVVKLPTRSTGYGLLEPYVRDMFAEDVRLLISADCGISNHREVALATDSLGMEVIITDHHLPPEELPEAAVAVLDPKIWDEEDPLAGVGVAWKLAWAVAREMDDPEGPRHLGRLLDLVAIGTVVDIAPLVGDNRTLAWMGLRYMNGGNLRPGIDSLVRAAKVRLPLSEEDLGWRIGPRINAIGRIKSAYPALELLLTNDRRRASEISQHLNELNSERQRRTRDAVDRCLALADPEQDFKVVFTDEIGGIAGLIAGRVAQNTGRPTAVLHRRADGSYGGSARAGETEVNLYRALHESSAHLGEWGGHRKAAGISVPPGSLDDFTASVNAAIRRQQSEHPEVFTPAIEVDSELSMAQLTNGILDWHERLAPFGSGNYRPVFVTEGLRAHRSRRLWEGMNLLTLDEGVPAKLAGAEPPEGTFDAAYTIGRSSYTGKLELEIVDWRRP